ncbi:MAG: hemolysin D, partial [Planctomycetaceae bacterium]|nr:hemolysin D [Planctomycetaceae bacterium]
MTNEVDLRDLAVDRDAARPRNSAALGTRLISRYVLPLVLILGLLSLVAWASRDLVFPPKSVTVVPVSSVTAEVQPEGTTLFKAAGWIEPRPTPIRVAALAPGV